MNKQLVFFRWRSSVLFAVLSMMLVVQASTMVAATYYVSTNGSVSNVGTAESPFLTIQQGVNAASAGDTVLVKTGTYHEWINITRSGTASARITIMAYPGHSPVIDGTDEKTGIDVAVPDWKGLFNSEGTNYITLDGFEIKNSNWYGIRGIKCTNWIVRNCKVHDSGLAPNKAEPIHFDQANYLVIQNNEVYNSKWNGINIMSGSNILIENNYVHDNTLHFGMQIITDHTNGITAFNYNNIFRNNIIGGNLQGIYSRNNVNMKIYNNLIYGTVGGGYAGILLGSGDSSSSSFVSGSEISNNTIINQPNSIANESHQNVTYRNNIFYSPTSAAFRLLGAGLIGQTMDYNCYYGTTTYSGEGDNGINANPQFVNAGANDYHLQSTSPAKDAGVTISYVGNDLAGLTRPQGAYDIGAYEYVNTTAVPTVKFTLAAQSKAESGGTATITAQLSGASGQAVTVPFTVTGTATRPADYAISASPITIAAGSTTGTATITIVNDVLDEANETVIVTMGTPTNATKGATTVHTLTITDDDAVPTVKFTLAAQSKAENGGTATITAQLSGASGQAVTVPFTVTGTATRPADYAISASPITIAAGSTTGTATITIANDVLDEADETVIVTMGTPTNATKGTIPVHTLIITDDDVAPMVNFTLAAQSKAESGGTATITAQLSGASGKAVSVPFAITGSATRPADYTISASPITIAAGSTTGTATITIVNDVLVEANETVIVTMGVPTYATKGTIGIHTLIITDDDAVTNNVPIANPQTGVTTKENTAKEITLTGSDADGDVLTYIIVTGPAHGTLTGTGAIRIYTPAMNYNGADSFTFKVNDGKADSIAAMVSISVNSIDIPSTAAFQGWAFDNQTGTFEVSFDAIPVSLGIDGVIGLSTNLATEYDDMAVMVRFSQKGAIEARNGSDYMSNSMISYIADTCYHFELVVDVEAHTYSAYVTPEGGSRLPIGENYTFRTTQAGADNLAYWNIVSSVGNFTISNFTIDIPSTPVFQGWAFDNQTGTFEVSFDAIPVSLGIDGVIGLSTNLATEYDDMAVMVRFSQKGAIEARNGSDYMSNSMISYIADTCYHFELVVDVEAHTYSAYVTPEGGSRLPIGENYTFRTTQAGADNLAYWNIVSSVGNFTISKFTIRK